MFIRSTGLGKTLLQCKVAKVEPSGVIPETLEMPKEGEAKEITRLLMTMQVIAPVTWTVRAFVEPADLRAIFGFALKNPGVLLSGVRFLFFGGKSPSLVVKKKEKRGSRAPAPALATEAPAGEAESK